MATRKKPAKPKADGHRKTKRGAKSKKPARRDHQTKH